MIKHLKRKLTEYRMSDESGIIEMSFFFLVFLALCSATSIPPTMHNQKPVVQLERSFGYDFNKDGKLDKAFAYTAIGSPRIPSAKYELDYSSPEFKALQKIYPKE
jgi:hypothetical protein